MNECGAGQKSSSERVKKKTTTAVEQSTIQMITRCFLVFLAFIVLDVVQSDEQPVRTNHRLTSSVACAINQQGFGQLERVQLASTSIHVQFKNILADVICPSIHVDVTITNVQTNKLERTIENIHTNAFLIDHLLPRQNYSIILKLSDEKESRLLPAHIFQTLLSSANQKTEILTNEDLLSIEQIEAFILPQTLLYIVTIPLARRRPTILANITLSSFVNGKQSQYHRLVKPLDNNVISHLGRMTTKTIAFSLELPSENGSSMEYTSFIQLFFANDQRQSILDHPMVVEPSPQLAADFLPVSSRSTRVLIRHLCSSYIEVKATVYHNSDVVARGQCDINKRENSPADIASGRCAILFDQLQPERNYSLAIRTTCPLTTASSSYVFYDRSRAFAFQTASGLPDDTPAVLTFYSHNHTLSWNKPTTNTSYLGPNYYYELFTRSTHNWTSVYRGNQTFYQLTSKLIETSNLTFRLYVANRYGRQEKNYSQLDVHINTAPASYSNNQIVIFTILISFLLLLLFGFLFLGCYLRNKKLYGKLKKKYYQNGDVSDKELEHLRSLTSPTGLKDNILYTWNHTPTNVDLNKLPKIERAMIKLDRLIGKGAFGEVYAGTATDNQSVAIKTLLSSASPVQREDFLKEAIIMNQFNHEHIVHLLGVCFQNNCQPQFLVIELMNQGDLQNYLRRSRPTKDNHHQCQLSYEECLDIARQIADGACYLERHSYVHRDLAARNCLVSSSESMSPGKVIVKIGDFGLARMLSQQDYYRKTGEALLPVRWMAPESLLDALFTSHSDMWSFGIVMWEIITLGQVPYSPLNNQQVISLVTTTRGTLQKPVQCTQALYELMVACWHYIPENRINFQDSHSRLNDMLSNQEREEPSIWFANESSSDTARNTLSCVLSHIEPPTSLSFEGSDAGECRSSTSGCFSSMTDSTSHTHPHSNQAASPYQLRLIDDTTSNDFADDDNHSDVIVRSL